ncbi:MAG: hypothetical protein VXZ63_01210, partial [Planctomycetota bacterium]|nr:hypothetical protein [Planctomycetota bacterium]
PSGHQFLGMLVNFEALVVNHGTTLVRCGQISEVWPIRDAVEWRQGAATLTLFEQKSTTIELEIPSG